MIAPASRAARFVRALFAVWLTFILTQPVAVHACAMRNGTLRTIPVTATVAQHDMAAATSGSTGAMGGMDHGTSAPSEQSSKCHCFGDCAATVQVATVAASYSLVPAPAHVLATPAVPNVVERSFEEPTYLHPPATAPPVAIA